MNPERPRHRTHSVGLGRGASRHRRSSMQPRAPHRGPSMVLSWPTRAIEGALWRPRFSRPPGVM
eukprot:1937329-Pyramimonas_sp.AAC.1